MMDSCTIVLALSRGKKNLFDLLQEVPVFIVEKPLAGKPISIPTPTIPVVSSKSFPTGKKHSKNPISSIAIDIPEDFWKNPFDDVSERSIKDWFDNVRRRMREDEANQKLKQQTIIQQCSSTKGMTDCLGLYVRDNHPTFPSRIFVWADKIEQAGGGCTDTLLRHVILHEIGHIKCDTTETEEERAILDGAFHFIYEQGQISLEELIHAYFEIPAETNATKWGVNFYKNNTDLCEKFAELVGLNN